MSRNWTFGQRIGASFAVAVAFTCLMGLAAILALRTVVANKDRVIGVNAQLLINAEVLNGQSALKAASLRGFMLLSDERFVEEWKNARTQAEVCIATLRAKVLTEEGKRMLDGIEKANAEYDRETESLFAFCRTKATQEAKARLDAETALPKRFALLKAVNDFAARESGLLEAARADSSRSASSAMTFLGILVGLCALVCALIAVWLTRKLKFEIGTAVGQVQSSSAELQATAAQQATGAKEQATAMNEISATISELLATSRQIAESAQQVARIADQTSQSARSGDQTIEKARESMVSIRRQVDLLVTHMLELGKKSQQIGSVLEIVAELAEQTNILAINATIEAAGAGEGGKRFAVVADEIRKLADRVASSTKEIRTLIEDVRGAVNTTVMATESGSKAVEAGAKQFQEVASTFKQISALVVTTTDAAREIELSTKQQSGGVEQVTAAVADVMQATRETEANTGQTLQTVSVLASLSLDLLHLVQPKV